MERGNALFLVLIGVVLFAALSYAVTQSDRNRGQSSMEERQMISSARLTEIGQSMQVAAERMIISGTRIEDIELHIPGDRSTPCSTGVNCLFAPEGGGLIWPTLPVREEIDKGATSDPPYIELYEITDNANKLGVGSPVVLMMIRRIGRTPCNNINAGLERPGLESVLMASLNSGNISAYSGETTGCVMMTGVNNDHNYFHVLAGPYVP